MVIAPRGGMPGCADALAEHGEECLAALGEQLGAALQGARDIPWSRVCRYCNRCGIGGISLRCVR